MIPLLLATILTAPTNAATPATPCIEGADVGPCTWDARHMGNGEGNSYRINKNGKLIIITHRAAHRRLGL